MNKASFEANVKSNDQLGCFSEAMFNLSGRARASIVFIFVVLKRVVNDYLFGDKYVDNKLSTTIRYIRLLNYIRYIRPIFFLNINVEFSYAFLEI